MNRRGARYRHTDRSSTRYVEKQGEQAKQRRRSLASAVLGTLTRKESIPSAAARAATVPVECSTASTASGGGPHAAQATTSRRVALNRTDGVRYVGSTAKYYRYGGLRASSRSSDHHESRSSCTTFCPASVESTRYAARTAARAHRLGSAREMHEAEPSRAGPSRAEPSRAAPRRAAPRRAAPRRAEPSTAVRMHRQDLCAHMSQASTRTTA